jgi:hypothetical protein
MIIRKRTILKIVIAISLFFSISLYIIDSSRTTHIEDTFKNLKKEKILKKQIHPKNGINIKFVYISVLLN